MHYIFKTGLPSAVVAFWWGCKRAANSCNWFPRMIRSRYIFSKMPYDGSCWHRSSLKRVANIRERCWPVGNRGHIWCHRSKGHPRWGQTKVKRRSNLLTYTSVHVSEFPLIDLNHCGEWKLSSLSMQRRWTDVNRSPFDNLCLVPWTAGNAHGTDSSYLKKGQPIFLLSSVWFMKNVRGIQLKYLWNNKFFNSSDFPLPIYM